MFCVAPFPLLPCCWMCFLSRLHSLFCLGFHSLFILFCVANVLIVFIFLSVIVFSLYLSSCLPQLVFFFLFSFSRNFISFLFFLPLFSPLHFFLFITRFLFSLLIVAWSPLIISFQYHFKGFLPLCLCSFFVSIFVFFFTVFLSPFWAVLSLFFFISPFHFLQSNYLQKGYIPFWLVFFYPFVFPLQCFSLSNAPLPHIILCLVFLWRF